MQKKGKNQCWPRTTASRSVASRAHASMRRSHISAVAAAAQCAPEGLGGSPPGGGAGCCAAASAHASSHTASASTWDRASCG